MLAKKPLNASNVSAQSCSAMKKLFKLTAALLTGVTVLMMGVLCLLWLDSTQIKDDYFDARKGALVSTSISETAGKSTQRSDLVGLQSDTGLTVTLRVLRPDNTPEPLPVLLILGGHRTGSKAVELLGDPGIFAAVVMDYPYDGPQSIHGLARTLWYLPGVRRGLLDIPPAVSLVLDWLHGQTWVDKQRIVMVGVSLGAPFAATAAARDQRLRELWLVHGAADNRLWLQANLARRIRGERLRSIVATVLVWVANGPTFDTPSRLAAIPPRPVLIIGARADERTPAGQTEKLFAAAGEPKSLRWTDGMHIEPGRDDVIEALMRIAIEQLGKGEQ